MYTSTVSFTAPGKLGELFKRRNYCFSTSDRFHIKARLPRGQWVGLLLCIMYGIPPCLQVVPSVAFLAARRTSLFVLHHTCLIHWSMQHVADLTTAKLCLACTGIVWDKGIMGQGITQEGNNLSRSPHPSGTIREGYICGVWTLFQVTTTWNTYRKQCVLDPP